MVKGLSRAGGRANRWAELVFRWAAWPLISAMGLLLVANAVFFVVHAAHMLAYPYPLDYGEGPLLQQVNLLRGGLPFWRLYADPGAPPYNVVNYPPIYPLAAWLVSFLTGDALLAGRLVSLMAALGASAALTLLSSRQSAVGSRQHRHLVTLSPCHLVILSFLALPIVREWAVVMRVDMLGVCLGLWGIVVVRRNAGRAAALWAVPLLLASLFTKPSLIAAPGAVVVWLLLRDWRRGVLVAGALALGGGLLVGLLQWASGGWFFFHVVTANANEWQATLARGFWHDQLLIHGTLFIAAALGVAVWLAQGLAVRTWRERRAILLPLALPLIYALLGSVTAIGVGKVGAYLNYFLELYAGLIWLVGCTILHLQFTQQRITSSIVYRLVSIVMLALVIGALLRYYPTWSQNYLKLAGVIEGENAPRLVVGRHGVWQDLQREQAILRTLGRVNAALVSDVQAAGAPIFTDVPGVAAQAGQLSRIQAFEHRQLHDRGVWNQRSLLLDMANGRVPLVVLDYLGNWLTPETIDMIKQRYAESGSRGTYDIYRPVDPGPRIAADLTFPDGLRLTGYHLAPSANGSTYEPGEAVLLTLEMTKDDTNVGANTRFAQTPDVVMQLIDSTGAMVQETARPLLYGALPPGVWPVGTPVEHMQPLALPPELLPGSYTVALTLRAGGHDLAPRPLTIITISGQGGRMLSDYFVPEPFIQAWQKLGADAALGEPLMPAVPFEDFMEQCFTRGCLTLRDGHVERLPLGELVLLGDVEGTAALPTSGTPALDQQFTSFYAAHGDEAVLGEPITQAFTRGEWLVQYTRYARLEHSQQTGETRLASLGVDYLRLPAGVPYRWP